MGMSVSRKTKTLFAIACAVLALAVAPIVTRRPTLTDPEEISKLPPNELRDAEIECLIRAALANATAVTIDSKVTLTDPQVLKDLAKQFAVGFDSDPLPTYRYPGLEFTNRGLEYARLTFNGPYEPQLEFTGQKRMWLRGAKPGEGRDFDVCTPFCRSIAELVGLKPEGRPVDRSRPGDRGNWRPFDDVSAER